MRALVEHAGLGGEIEVDSAGTGAWHVGSAPDARASAAARVIRRVGGGDINEAYHVVLADGREAFVKTRADAARGEYAAEAAGLQWLAQARALRTPAVLELGEDHLALEWVAPGRLGTAG